MDNLPIGEDTSKLLQSLMADERFGEVLEAVKGAFSTDAENSAPSTSSPPTPDEAEPVSSAPIPAIPQLSPELMSKLPSIMSMLSAEKADGKNSSRLNDRKRLLQALKPFLSQGRRDAVDSIVNIAGIADLLGL